MAPMGGQSSRGSDRATMLAVLSGFLLSFALGSVDGTQGQKCSQLTVGFPKEVKNSSNWTCFCYEGQTQASYLLWSKPVIKVKFANDSYHPEVFNKVYGDSEEEVWKKTTQPNPFLDFLQKLKLVFNQEWEEISLKAFNKSCVAILSDTSYKLRLTVKYVEVWYVAYLAAGVLIFLSAKTWSHNSYIHYSTGVTIGVMASIIILLFVLRRLFPQSLRRICYVLMAVATSTSLWFWTEFARQIFNPVTNTLSQYWQYALGYVFVTGLISFCVCYRYGPVTDSRSLNLIQWGVQALGLFLIYQGTQIPELSVAIIVILLTLYNIPRGLYRNRFTRYLSDWKSVVYLMAKNYFSWIRYKYFTPTPRLLTEEEYIRQGHEETKKALDELRSFCRSPECDTWKVISHLTSPTKFAKFIEGDSWHVTNEELLEYDSGPEPTPPTDLDDPSDDSNDDEMDFILSSP